MKNTFAVSMTLLLALTLGGSLVAYNMAVQSVHGEAHQAEAPAASEAAPSESTPSEAAATGNEAGAAGAVAGGAAGTAEPAAEPVAAGDAAAGEKLYASLACAGCHGATGAGGVGLPLNKPDGPMSWTDDQFKATLREGKTPTRQLGALMPRFTEAQVSDADIVNIHAFVKTLK